MVLVFSSWKRCSKVGKASGSSWATNFWECTLRHYEWWHACLFSDFFLYIPLSITLGDTIVNWLDLWAGLAHHFLCSWQISKIWSERVVCFSQHACLRVKREVSYCRQKKEGIFTTVATMAYQNTNSLEEPGQGRALLGKMKLILRQHLKAGPFSHQQHISPARIQLQLSVLQPNPEITKASLTLLTVQNVGRVSHGQEKRRNRVANKTKCEFFFRIMMNMFHNN